MKVLFFNTLSAVNGGAERVLFDTSLELLERGHEVSVVAAYDDRRSRNPESWPGEINRYYIPELIRPVTGRRTYDAYRRSSFYKNGLRYAQDVIPEKGLLELVQAVGRTRSNPTLLAVGTDETLWSGAYRNEIIREAQKWGVRLETEPWSTGKELRLPIAGQRWSPSVQSGPNPSALSVLKRWLTASPLSPLTMAVSGTGCGMARQVTLSQNLTL